MEVLGGQFHTFWKADQQSSVPESRSVAPFLGAFRAGTLSLKKVRLEFAKLVLYYSFALSGVVPHDAEASDLLLVSSNESFR
jgi:hypothetical protein